MFAMQAFPTPAKEVGLVVVETVKKSGANSHPTFLHPKDDHGGQGCRKILAAGH